MSLVSSSGNEQSLSLADEETNSEIACTWTGQSSSRSRARSLFHAWTFDWFLPFLVSLRGETTRRLSSKVFSFLFRFLDVAPELRGLPRYLRSASILLQLITHFIEEEAYDVIESSSPRAWISYLLDIALLRGRGTCSEYSLLPATLHPASVFPLIARQARNTIILLLRKGGVASAEARRYAELVRPLSNDDYYKCYFMTEQDQKRLCERLVNCVKELTADLPPQPALPQQHAPPPQSPQRSDDDILEMIIRKRQAEIIVISDSSSSSEDEMKRRGRRKKKKTAYSEDKEWTPSPHFKHLHAQAVKTSSKKAKKNVAPSRKKKERHLETVVQNIKERPQRKKVPSLAEKLMSSSSCIPVLKKRGAKPSSSALMNEEEATSTKAPMFESTPRADDRLVSEIQPPNPLQSPSSPPSQNQTGDIG